MLLDSVYCAGYRAFDSESALRLKPLTVIFGRNNSGKSTLVRLPMFIAASLVNQEDYYVTSAGGLSFATSFQELASIDQPHPRLSYGATWAKSKSLGVELQYVNSQEGRDSVQLASLNVDEARYQFDLAMVEHLPSRDLLHRELNEAARRTLKERTSEMQLISDGILHVHSSRPWLSSSFEMRSPQAWKTSETPYLLVEHRDLLRQVNEWFNNSLDGTSLDIERAAFAFRVVVKGAEDRAAVNVSQAGRGTQSVIPVATLLTAVASGSHDASLVLVEEPEAHLHPSAHGATADLLISCASKAQVLVETHSENLILRLRRRIAERQLSASAVGLYYVDAGHALHEIHLDDDGVATNWPSGVFEYDVEEAEAIVAAKLIAMRGGFV